MVAERRRRQTDARFRAAARPAPRRASSRPAKRGEIERATVMALSRASAALPYRKSSEYWRAILRRGLTAAIGLEFSRTRIVGPGARRGREKLFAFGLGYAARRVLARLRRRRGERRDARSGDGARLAARRRRRVRVRRRAARAGFGGRAARRRYAARQRAARRERRSGARPFRARRSPPRRPWSASSISRASASTATGAGPGSTRRARRRRVRRAGAGGSAPRRVARLGAARGVPVDILRLAGIYGPGRNALVKLREGDARRIVKPGQVFNRIHVDDIAAVISAADRGRRAGRGLERRRRGARAAAGRRRLRRRTSRRRAAAGGAVRGRPRCRRWRAVSTATTVASRRQAQARTRLSLALSDLSRGPARAGGGGRGAARSVTAPIISTARPPPTAACRNWARPRRAGRAPTSPRGCSRRSPAGPRAGVRRRSRPRASLRRSWPKRGRRRAGPSLVDSISAWIETQISTSDRGSVSRRNSTYSRLSRSERDTTPITLPPRTTGRRLTRRRIIASTASDSGASSSMVTTSRVMTSAAVRPCSWA